VLQQWAGIKITLSWAEHKDVNKHELTLTSALRSWTSFSIKPDTQTLWRLFSRTCSLHRQTHTNIYRHTQTQTDIYRHTQTSTDTYSCRRQQTDRQIRTVISEVTAPNFTKVLQDIAASLQVLKLVCRRWYCIMFRNAKAKTEGGQFQCLQKKTN